MLTDVSDWEMGATTKGGQDGDIGWNTTLIGMDSCRVLGSSARVPAP